MNRLNLLMGLTVFVAGNLCAGPIQWSGTRDIVISGGIPSPTYYTVDMNADSVGDVHFEEGSESWFLTFEMSPLNGNQTAVTPDGGGFESNPLPFGESIGNVLPSPFEWDSGDYTLRKWLHVDEEGGSGGPSTQVWPSYGESGYMGVSFDVDGEVHYGWIHLTVGEHENRSYAGMIHSWAWNTTPGEGLWAGQVPEPSTWALFGLGGIVLLVALRRKSRCGCDEGHL